jgi:hypothetical protein
MCEDVTVLQMGPRADSDSSGKKFVGSSWGTLFLVEDVPPVQIALLVRGRCRFTGGHLEVLCCRGMDRRSRWISQSCSVGGVGGMHIFSNKGEGRSLDPS